MDFLPFSSCDLDLGNRAKGAKKIKKSLFPMTFIYEYELDPYSQEMCIYELPT